MIRHVELRALSLGTLLVLAPLPFGGALYPYSTALFCATLVVLVFATLPFRKAVDSPVAPLDARPESRVPVLGPALLVAAIGLFGVAQALPWPASVARRVAPRLVELARIGTSLIQETRDFGKVPLSLAPAASRDAVFDWWLPAAAAIAAGLVARSRRGRRAVLAGLLAAATVQIAIGIQLWISRSSSLWGTEIPGSGDRLRGSFVNPNHAALFLEIALAAAFAWMWWSVRRSLREDDRAELRLLRVGPPALAFLLIFSGIVLTGSRAGVLAAIAALATQGFLVGRARGRNWFAAAGGIAAVAGIAFVSIVGVEGALQRLAATALDDVAGGGRARAALATLELWTFSPVTGLGLGSFRAAFPLVQPETLPGLWRHAHSDWAELLATTGLVGGGLLVAALGLYLRRLRCVISRGERSEDRAAGIAATGALVAAGLHSCVDFGLTLPANAFALAVVVGSAAAASTSREMKRGTPAGVSLDRP